MAGRYLIVDMGTEPPALVTTDDVLPAVIVQALNEIKELIMTDSAAEQAQINTLADAINVVAQHQQAAATQIQQYIADHPDMPPADLTPLTSAVASLQNADTGLAAVLPAVPVDAPPPADPIPAPPADPTVPVDTGTPVDTTGTDAGGATDGTTTDTTGTPPDQPAPSF